MTGNGVKIQRSFVGSESWQRACCETISCNNGRQEIGSKDLLKTDWSYDLEDLDALHMSGKGMALIEVIILPLTNGWLSKSLSVIKSAMCP